MKAKYIYETLGDILKPKSEQDVNIPADVKDLILDCYNLVTQYPDLFGITEEIGINCDKFNGCYYGFEFIVLSSNEKMILQFNGDDGAVLNIQDSEYYAEDIYSVDDFMFTFKLYEPIEEGMGDILKGKSIEELDAVMPRDAREFIETAYATIEHNKKFVITTPLGYFREDSGYGFQFEGTEPLDPETYQYHGGEIPEYTLGYFPKYEGIYVSFDNSGHDYHVESMEEFEQFIGLNDDDMEQPQGMFETISDVLKPKSKEELKKQFEKDNPKFVKIFKELFPKHDYDIDVQDDGIEASFAFSETDKHGEVHTFLIKQNKYEKNNPIISYLDKSRGNTDLGIGGIFLGGNHVIDTNEVHNYVKNKVNPVYDRR